MQDKDSLVDPVSGKPYEEIYREHDEYMEARYKVGQVLGTTEGEYEDRRDMLPPVIQGSTVIDGDTFVYFAMGEPLYHSDFRDGRRGVAVATWYFQCSTPASWGRLSDNRPVRLARAKKRFFTVNDTVSSQGRSRAMESVASAYRNGLAR